MSSATDIAIDVPPVDILLLRSVELRACKRSRMGIVLRDISELIAQTAVLANELKIKGVAFNPLRHLYLWTKRGCARHAKILTTEKAWQVFEEFEDAYVRVLLSFDNLREG